MSNHTVTQAYGEFDAYCMVIFIPSVGFKHCITKGFKELVYNKTKLHVPGISLKACFTVH